MFKNLTRVFLVSVLTFVCSQSAVKASNTRRQPPVIYNPKPVDLRPKTEVVRPYVKKNGTYVDSYRRSPRR